MTQTTLTEAEKAEFDRKRAAFETLVVKEMPLAFDTGYLVTYGNHYTNPECKARWADFQEGWEASKTAAAPVWKTPVNMQPGDDLHLTMLMARHGLNFVTGQDRNQLLAWGRDVWQASKNLDPTDRTNVVFALGLLRGQGYQSCADTIERLLLGEPSPDGQAG